MIFDKNYDNSLWCILAGDKKNRYRILEFIKSIPPELLEQIQSGILKLKQYEQEEGSFEKIADIFGSIETNDGILYSFQFDGMGTLELEKRVKNGEYYDLVFELDLLDFPEPDEIENFDDEWLGNIMYNIKSIHHSDTIEEMTCDESEYQLIKTPFGYLLTYSRENALIIKAFGRFISLKKIPDDLHVNDLNVFYKPNKLTRKNCHDKKS